MEKSKINNENFDNITKEIKIFSNNDEKLKFLGKILNNNSSREIIQLLIKKEMTANEIALQTKLSLPLILHYINQMIRAEIVTVSKTENNAKNQPMKYYSAKDGLGVLDDQVVANYASAGGDSGAPVFTVTSGTSVKILGQHVGKFCEVDLNSGHPNPYSYWCTTTPAGALTVFSPWPAVKTKLGI